VAFRGKTGLELYGDLIKLRLKAKAGLSVISIDFLSRSTLLPWKSSSSVHESFTNISPSAIYSFPIENLRAVTVPETIAGGCNGPRWC